MPDHAWLNHVKSQSRLSALVTSRDFGVHPTPILALFGSKQHIHSILQDFTILPLSLILCCTIGNHTNDDWRQVSDRSRIIKGDVPPESLHSSPRWFDAGEGWSSNRLPIWIFSCRCLRGLAKVGSPNIPTTSRTKATGTDSNWGEISKRSCLLPFHDNYTSEILWLCKTLQDNTEHHEPTKMDKSAWIVWSILWLDVIGIFKAGKWELVNLVKHNAYACCMGK